jgi:SAM-dependent methyltransferase
MKNLAKIRFTSHLRQIYRTTIYLTKNLTFLLPIRYGYYKKLETLVNPSYNHDRDKNPIRNKHHGQGGWTTKTDNSIHYRDYSSYEEYQIHQKQKFDEILKIKGGFTNREILQYRVKFYRRFRDLAKLLPSSAIILCAGARQGTEVEVLQDLGFEKAFGIDLNPGPYNKYVRQGDFMALECADASIDMIYSNCIDHAFNLEKFLQEHTRVIKPGGFVLYDIAIQSEQGGGAFEAVEWDSEETLFLMMMKYFGKVVKVETEKSWKWVLLQKIA